MEGNKVSQRRLRDRMNADVVVLKTLLLETGQSQKAVQQGEKCRHRIFHLYRLALVAVAVNARRLL